jgi:hypothetical protein
MSILVGVLGIILILIILGDAFETVILPRRVTRRISLARMFHHYTWLVWLHTVRLIFREKRQETYLGWFGPLSLILLLIVWASCLVIGFALVHWASGSGIQPLRGTATFGTYLYLSGTTFFTLGIGDVVPVTSFGRAIIAFEAGMGFGFIALLIGYLPALNQSFSRREVSISLLDARAGSPPTAAELLQRHAHDHGLEDLRGLLHDWERWSADLLESHLSYPVLAYFRSHHDHQSWLEALTAILDASAFLITHVGGPSERQAELTFAVTRHAVVDLSNVLNCRPLEPDQDRFPPRGVERLRAALAERGVKLSDVTADRQLRELRRMYEPYICSLSRYLRITIPPWIPEPGAIDNWQQSAWDRSRAFEIEGLSRASKDDHL